MKAGFALGASLDNSVGIDDGRILNPEGLRYTDEFVRHKMLDAVGDLALAGAPLIGAYHSYCGGHKMNVAVLEALFSDRVGLSHRRIGPGAPRRRPRRSRHGRFAGFPAGAQLNPLAGRSGSPRPVLKSPQTVAFWQGLTRKPRSARSSIGMF